MLLCRRRFFAYWLCKYYEQLEYSWEGDCELSFVGGFERVDALGLAPECEYGFCRYWWFRGDVDGVFWALLYADSDSQQEA